MQQGNVHGVCLNTFQNNYVMFKLLRMFEKFATDSQPMAFQTILVVFRSHSGSNISG